MQVSSGFNCKRGEKVDQVYDEHRKSEIAICRKFSDVLMGLVFHKMLKCKDTNNRSSYSTGR